ncbi:hypothetical protein L2E82_42840 [Cichorium intybus]|uniref:Uncharacterized protein n=1 Tax=Cichorium intybus TaxID=13427 RepID=A0ACB8ZNM7_CICIN|nr:hypothetical protein L2E82_42840 [Cichorium intybus]
MPSVGFLIDRLGPRTQRKRDRPVETLKDVKVFVILTHQLEHGEKYHRSIEAYYLCGSDNDNIDFIRTLDLLYISWSRQGLKVTFFLATNPDSSGSPPRRAPPVVPFVVSSPIMSDIPSLKRYIKTDFFIDLIATFTHPQIVIWFIIPATRSSKANHNNNALALIVLLQYIPRLYLVFPLSSELVKATGVVTKKDWAGVAYNLM